MKIDVVLALLIAALAIVLAVRIARRNHDTFTAKRGGHYVEVYGCKFEHGTQEPQIWAKSSSLEDIKAAVETAKPGDTVGIPNSESK